MEGSQGLWPRAAPDLRGPQREGRRAGATSVCRRAMGGKVPDDRRRMAAGLGERHAILRLPD